MITQLEKISNTNFLFLLLLGVIVFLIKVFEIISPSLFDFKLLPIIDLLIVTFGIISAKYFFSLRTKIDRFTTVKVKQQLYTRYSIFIMVILDIIYAINLLIFLFTMNLIYVLVAGLIILLYVIYRPSNENFNKELLEEKNN